MDDGSVQRFRLAHVSESKRHVRGPRHLLAPRVFFGAVVMRALAG